MRSYPANTIRRWMSLQDSRSTRCCWRHRRKRLETTKRMDRRTRCWKRSRANSNRCWRIRSRHPGRPTQSTEPMRRMQMPLLRMRASSALPQRLTRPFSQPFDLLLLQDDVCLLTPSSHGRSPENSSARLGGSRCEEPHIGAMVCTSFQFFPVKQKLSRGIHVSSSNTSPARPPPRHQHDTVIQSQA